MERFTTARPAERAVWLEERRRFFNASAAATLWDRHPYLSQATYATLKLSGREESLNRNMERGNRLELPVAQWWADDYHHELIVPAVLYACDHLLYTPDFLTVLPDEHDTDLVEVKTARGYVGEPELHWLDQCQAACLIADKPGIHLVWFDSTLDYGYVWVERDEQWGQAIYEASKQFMAFIEMGMVPEGVMLNYRQQTEVHPLATVAKVELDDAGYGWVESLSVARRARMAAEQDEDRAKAELARLLGDAEEGWWWGAPVVTWRNNRPTTQFDAKAMVAAYPELAETFTKPKLGARVMRVVGKQEETDD